MTLLPGLPSKNKASFELTPMAKVLTGLLLTVLMLMAIWGGKFIAIKWIKLYGLVKILSNAK